MTIGVKWRQHNIRDEENEEKKKKFVSLEKYFRALEWFIHFELVSDDKIYVVICAFNENWKQHEREKEWRWKGNLKKHEFVSLWNFEVV